MVIRKRSTPDGRVTSYATPSRPDRPAAADPALSLLQPFIDSCLTVIPEGTLSGAGRTGFVLFLIGAADQMWTHYGLDPRRFAAFAANLLQLHGVESDAAATIALNLPRLPESAPARAALVEGAEVFAQWREGHDPNAVLRLTQLAPRWQRDGFGSGAGA
jgi:hypothetical protein